MSRKMIWLYLFYDKLPQPLDADAKLAAAAELFLTNFKEVRLSVFSAPSRSRRQWMTHLGITRLPAFALFPRRPRKIADPTLPFIAAERPALEALTPEQLYYLFSDLFFSILDGILELQSSHAARSSILQLFPGDNGKAEHFLLIKTGEK